jgi:hypothetical protein
LEESLQNFASQRLGFPMLFDLCEQLKEELHVVQHVVDAGSFGGLPDEAISCILDYIPPVDLSA